jgi:hypothetical protein
MRKKHDPPKNIRTKDGRENFTYFLFEVDRGRKYNSSVQF